MCLAALVRKVLVAVMVIRTAPTTTVLAVVGAVALRLARMVQAARAVWAVRAWTCQPLLL